MSRYSENDRVEFRRIAGGAMRQMAAELGLAIMLYQPFRDFEGNARQELLA
ncbi:hypothetical protein ACRAWF_08850 [Streptomyces sp. L7]